MCKPISAFLCLLTCLFVCVGFFLPFKNAIMGISEKTVCFNVDTVWMIPPVTTLMAPVPVDVWQDGRTQISVINVCNHFEIIEYQKLNLLCLSN